MNRTVVNNDDAIRRLLDEAGVEQTAPLAASLQALKAAGNEAPAAGPSPELLAFMTPGTGAVPDPAPNNVVPFRRRRGVRGAALGLAVVAATGLGVSGVAAANPDFRSAAGGAVEQVVRFFDPTAGEQQAVPAGETPDGATNGSGIDADGRDGNGAGSDQAGGEESGTSGSGSSISGQAGGAADHPASGNGKGSAGSGAGNAADPARVPEQAGGGLTEPGSARSQADETARRLLDDARGTQPSGVVPSLPAEDVLPVDSAVPGNTVPGLPADAPSQEPAQPKN